MSLAIPALALPAFAGAPSKPAAPKAHIDLPLPANAEHLGHGRFDDVIVYKPSGTPTSFALVLSGDHGWNKAANELAEELVQKGAMVTGVDTPQFIAMLERDDGDCEYTSGDLENLSHFVQAYYKLPTYLPPVMVASGEGAPLAYATAAQAPEDTFGGALLLGFRPTLAMRKPLCTKGNDLQFTPHAGGQGYELLPSPKLASQVTLLQGDADKDYPPAAAKDFAGRLGKGSVVELAGVGQDYAETAQWQPQLVQTYDRLQQALKPTELALPPADLNGLPVIDVPAKAGVPQTEAFAVLISGDGGWAGLDQEVAGALSAEGIPVVGVDSLRYFWTARTPESTAADTDRIVRYYLDHWHKQQVLLVGYSQGADVMPFIINRLPAETRKHVALGAVMGLSEHALFEFHVGNWVDANQDQGLPTAPEMEHAGSGPGPTPMLCIYGEGETDTLCPKLNPAKVKVIKLPGGHHFGGDYQRLAREILATANLQPLPAGAQTYAAAGDQNQSSNKEEAAMTFHIAVTPLLSLIAGILILLVPRLLNYIVAIYLILLGVLGMFPHLIHLN